MEDTNTSGDDEHPNFVCPECDGPLTEKPEGKLITFSCKIGHRFSLEGLSEAHSETLERGLWIAVRILEDRSAIHRLRASKFQEEGNDQLADSLIEIAAQAENDAQVLREIMQKL